MSVSRRCLRSRGVAVAATAAVTLALSLASCGGGGGGQPAASVHFTGFTFQIADNAATALPPMEDLQSLPPTLGGPLDMKIVFHFDGVPQGPFTQQNLPIFTTPEEVIAEAFPPLGVATIPAKGNYVPVGNDVEFRPFIPIHPLSIKLSSPPEAVPGLLPGSVYTAQVVTTTGSKIPNLVGAGGSVQFGTTSNPASYFATGGGDGKPPVVVVAVPADGSTGFSPRPFGPVAPGADVPTFPDGPSRFTLTYDHPLLPTEANLFGSDLDGDGLLDPSLFLRSRATRLLVAHTVPAVSSVGSFASAFPALSGLSEGEAVPPLGTAIFLHDSEGAGAFPGGDPSLTGTPVSLAVGADPSLLFVVLQQPGANDRISVVDHVLGDPSFAQIADAPAIDSQLDELVGLTVLQDGRLVGYDRTTRRLYELLTTVVRDRPHPGSSAPGKPVLASVTLGTGAIGAGFRSEVFPAGLDVIDLAQAPSGAVYALADASGVFPVLARLNAIDFGLDDGFDATDGLPAAGAATLPLASAYAAIEFTAEDRLLALNRSDDSIDVLSPTQGKLSTAVSGVAAFGVSLAALPGGLSPATAMALGYMTQDVAIALEQNDATGAVVDVEPVGVLPVDAEIELMQRNNFSALTGVSAANVDPSNFLSVLGSHRVLGVTTAAPIHTVGPCGVPDPEQRVHDAFTEEFVDTTYQDPDPPTVNPQAEWAKPINGAITSGNLRASVGQAPTAGLGDFVPLPNTNFDPSKAYSQAAGVPAGANFRFIVLDTDVQGFPLPNGATPGITTPISVVGGKFGFRDFIIPEGVWVIVRGSRPLVITASGKVEIRGVLDVSGSDGVSDDTFDTGFTPVPGGIGGPGGGRGGASHPTVWNPKGPQQINQFATPASGERGSGPVIGPTGAVTFAKVGGFGGLTTLGYVPDDLGYPFLLGTAIQGGPGTGSNTEHSRPPGGGGGSYYFHGMAAHLATGSYRVGATPDAAGALTNVFFPSFKLCPTNNKINDSLYGNEEHRFCGGFPVWPLQCVYMQGTPSDPVLFQPGGLPSDEPLFVDGDPDNDYFGPDGELQVLLGGQGGGGGGSRIDSMVHLTWAIDQIGTPVPSPPAPPCYPQLNFNATFFSPTVYDAKGGGGGGGGGSVLIRSFGDIIVTKTGHIDASGGEGGGGETIESCNYSGGGGGGSGGAIILQAAHEIRIEADPQHRTPYFMDTDGWQGGSLDVSGGYGYNAVTTPNEIPSQFGGSLPQWTRSDGGQGGFGLIQLQEGSADAMPEIRQGAFAFARQRAVLKLGPWTDPLLDAGEQAEHPSWPVSPLLPPLPDELRYIDMLEYRYFKFDAFVGATMQRFFFMNGSDPPIIQVTDSGNIGPFQLDTPMIDYFGKRVVREPQPQKVMKTYFGWNPLTFVEPNTPPPSGPPGTLYAATDDIPFSIYLKEPDGTPLKKTIDGTEQFDPDVIVDRLPVVHPSKTPPSFGAVSRGTSQWLDYGGAALRARSVLGVPPPLFDGIHGTYNALEGLVPVGKDGLVVTAGTATAQAHFVKNAGLPPFDPGLCTTGGSTVPFNDIKVDAPDIASPIENAVSDNATVALQFQGAYPVRAGSHVPDPGTLTAWVSDLRELSGYPLIRFQVTFDLAKDTATYPISADSFRPSVDRVRLRAQY